MMRPTMSIAMSCDAETMMQPITQMTAPIMIALLRPNMSEMKPEHSEASQEPPAMEAVIPPWVFEVGPAHGLGP